jgi:metal-sulfur cluster biosynthetic enzyme
MISFSSGPTIPVGYSESLVVITEEDRSIEVVGTRLTSVSMSTTVPMSCPLNETIQNFIFWALTDLAGLVRPINWRFTDAQIKVGRTV